MKKEMIGVLGGCLLLGLAGSASAEILTLDTEVLQNASVKGGTYYSLGYSSLDGAYYNKRKDDVELIGTLGGDWSIADKRVDYSEIELFGCMGQQCTGGNGLLNSADYDGYSLSFKNMSDQPIMIKLGLGYMSSDGPWAMPDYEYTEIAPQEKLALSYSRYDEIPEGAPIVGVGFVFEMKNTEWKTQMLWSNDYQVCVSATE